ncbi:MAG: hypothetical protein Q9165_005598 [Trypethelium subeluteriae]
MSASRNADAVVNQEGQVGSHVARDEPLTTHGHKPGVIASERDAAPEFSAQTLPAGTAPPDRTFAPNANNEAPPISNYSSNVDAEAPRTDPLDTLGGVTSGDVHTGLGHPGQGQSSRELRHGEQHGGHGKGLAGIGASGAGSGGGLVDARQPEAAGQRALGKEGVIGGTRGTIGGEAAEERIPEGAETVARENN